MGTVLNNLWVQTKTKMRGIRTGIKTVIKQDLNWFNYARGSEEGKRDLQMQILQWIKTTKRSQFLVSVAFTGKK